MSDPKRTAVVTAAGDVDNVIVWDGVAAIDLAEGEQLVLCPDFVSPGWRYIAGDFVPATGPDDPA